jgi:hypothetical protein
MLIFKYILWKISLVVGVLGSCVPSTLCLYMMHISMIINNTVFVCILLNCCLKFITTTIFGERERDKVKP